MQLFRRMRCVARALAGETLAVLGEAQVDGEGHWFHHVLAHNGLFGLALTLLALGVFALVVMTSVMDGVVDKVSTGFKGLSFDGTIQLNQKSPETTEEQKRFAMSPGLRYEDLSRLTSPHPKVRAFLPRAMRQTSIRIGTGLERTFATGVTAEYFPWQNRPIASGRALTDDDSRRRSAVAVLGGTLASKLFSGSDPVGRTISIDGQSFRDIESAGRAEFLGAIREDLVTGSYKPMPNRKVEIPKGNGKVRTLQIPCIRDRVVQGALKLILEAVFEADFCPNSYGFRPKRSPHRALAEVRRSVMRRMSTVIDVDLSRYFDTIRHSVLLDKIAKRIQDPQVLHLVKQIIKVGGKVGVPQGGPFSPLAANIYLNEVDWFFDAIRRKTAEGNYEAVNYHRFADDIVITVSGHHTKRGWAERARQRLQEQIAPLGVELNLEKTRMVNTLRGQAFGFLGFDLRRVRKQGGEGHFILMTPKKKARQAVKAKVRDIIARGGATPAAELVKRVRDQLGAVVSLRQVDVIAALPKTRSGKVLRKNMRSIADGVEIPVPSTIDNPATLEALRPILRAE